MTDTPKSFDHVFRDAYIVDGSGGAPYRGELAVKGDRIAKIGKPGSVPPGSGRRGA